MSQAVTVRAAAPPTPVISPKLAHGLVDFAATWTPANRYAAALVDEAKAALPALEAHLTPAPANLIETWLRHLRQGTAAISEPDFKQRLAAIQLASGDLPAWVWCMDALRDALRNPLCRFFPSAADIDGMLRPRASAALNRAWQCRRLAAATPIAPEPVEPAQRLPVPDLRHVAIEPSQPNFAPVNRQSPFATHSSRALSADQLAALRATYQKTESVN
jgi:hypothetical protein